MRLLATLEFESCPQDGERGVSGSRGAAPGEVHAQPGGGWRVPWSLLHPEGSRRKSSMSGFRAGESLPAANAGFQPVDVRLVPAQDPHASVSADTRLLGARALPSSPRGVGWPALLGRGFSGQLMLGEW